MAFTKTYVTIALGLVLGSCSVLVEGRIVDRVEDCTNEENGMPCVGGDYCIANDCRFSFCGDGFVNADRGEECDDANVLATDGCQPTTCAFTCDGMTPCADDGNVCNGPESCSASDHLCSSGPFAPGGTGCVRSGGTPGSCTQGFCVAPGCGDGIVVGPEQCEAPSAGCQPDCTWVCDADGDCPSLDYCENLRVCDLAIHQCVDAPTPSCADGDTCTAEHCDPIIGCVSDVPDKDGDGFVAGTEPCGATSPYMPGDCDDMEPGVNPGASEQCNGVDDNCRDGVDENVEIVLCLRDGDRDSYGILDGAYSDCKCGEAYVVDVRDRPHDCNDAEININPAADPSSYHYVPHCPLGGAPAEVDRESDRWTCPNNEPHSWDWNCDLVVERQNPYTYAQFCDASCPDGGGYMSEVPPCGGSGLFTDCYQCMVSAFPQPRAQLCR